MTSPGMDGPAPQQSMPGRGGFALVFSSGYRGDFSFKDRSLKLSQLVSVPCTIGTFPAGSSVCRCALWLAGVLLEEPALS